MTGTVTVRCTNQSCATPPVELPHPTGSYVPREIVWSIKIVDGQIVEALCPRCTREADR